MYYIDIDLSKYRDAEFVTRDVDGIPEEGIWIPIKRNGFVFGRHKTVHARFLMKERQPNLYGISHYLSMYVKDKKLRDEFLENGFKNEFNFVGYAKPSFSYKSQKMADHVHITPLEDAMDK